MTFSILVTRNGTERTIATAYDESDARSLVRALMFLDYSDVRYQANVKQPKQRYASATIFDPAGKDITIAVAVAPGQSSEDTRSDMLTAANTLTRMPFGAIRLHDIKIVRSVDGLTPIPQCSTAGATWAWHS